MRDSRATDVVNELTYDKDLLDLFLSYGLDVNNDITFIKGKTRKSFHYPQSQQETIYNTPLLIAIANNDIELIKKLIRSGANVNVTGKEGCFHGICRGGCLYDGVHDIRPLQLALDYNHRDVVVLLINNGAGL